MTELPDKLSDLIELALKDFDACLADDRYEIDMLQWHDGDGEICRVCLAGAVMAQTLGALPDEVKLPSMYDLKTARKLRVLDALRQGSRGSRYPYEAILDSVEVERSPDTAFDRSFFENLIVELRKVGE